MIQHIIFQLSSCSLIGDFTKFELFHEYIKTINFEKLGNWLALWIEELCGQAIYFYLLHSLGGSLKELINGIKNIMTV